LELLDADLDPVDAYVIHEMGHQRLGHDYLFSGFLDGIFPAA
jgi:hypothetical protein